MDSNSIISILSKGGMLLEDDKATEQMQKSISKFASLLICPLCNKIFDRPATLSACGHTYCMNCIDAYSSKNCNCPACGMPISIVGSNGGSFRKLNLQISQTIESLQLICNNLNQSKKNWWLSHATLQSIKETKSSKMNERQEVSPQLGESEDQVDFPFDERLRRNGNQPEDEDDELKMIDLQANEEERLCLSIDDDKDGHVIDGNINADGTV